MAWTERVNLEILIKKNAAKPTKEIYSLSKVSGQLKVLENRSTGLNGLASTLLKQRSFEPGGELTNMFKSCINQSFTSQNCKYANITLIPKLNRNSKLTIAPSETFR